VLSHAGRAEMRWLRFRPLMRIGTISYGLYLYHYPLVVMTHDLSTALAMWTLAPFFRLAAVIFTIPIAVLSWRLVEQPILRWKSRFEYANGSETLPGKPVVVRDRRHVGREV
jgi:peptidoglycan/LPS O-acetylase OafA/YrhL